MSARDRRVFAAFSGNPQQQAYMVALEGRVSSLEAADYELAAPGFSATAENGNVIRCGVQLHDTAGAVLDYQAVVRVYLSTTQKAAHSGVDTSAAIATTGTILLEEQTRAWWTILTNSTGFFDLELGHSAAGTFYVNVLWLDRVYVAGAVTFA